MGNEGKVEGTFLECLRTHSSLGGPLDTRGKGLLCDVCEVERTDDEASYKLESMFQSYGVNVDVNIYGSERCWTLFLEKVAAEEGHEELVKLVKNAGAVE